MIPFIPLSAKMWQKAETPSNALTLTTLPLEQKLLLAPETEYDPAPKRPITATAKPSPLESAAVDMTVRGVTCA